MQRMSNDLGLSAGGVIDGTETIEEVGATRIRSRDRGWERCRSQGRNP